MNENYPHPAMPEGAEEGILRGMYLLRAAERRRRRVQLLGSGTILREVIAGGRAAARGLRRGGGRVERDVASPSCAATGMEAERWNRLHPREEPRSAVRRRASLDGARRPGRRRDRLHARASPTRSGRGSTRRTRCSAPTASAAATTARALRALLRGGPPPRRARGAARRSAAGGEDAAKQAIEQVRASTPRRRRRGGCEARSATGHGPRHRRLRRRAGDRDAGRARRHVAEPRSRWSRWSPTRRRWRCRRRSPAWSRSSRWRSATRCRRATLLVSSTVAAAATAPSRCRAPWRSSATRQSEAGAPPRSAESAIAAEVQTRRPGARRRRARVAGAAAASSTCRSTLAGWAGDWRASAASTCRACRAAAARAASRAEGDGRGAAARPAPAADGCDSRGRRGRARPADPHPAASSAPSAHAHLADDPARHPARRSRHHRPRGVPQAARTPSSPTSR